MKKYQPQRKADEYQSKALTKMRGKKAFALLMAMRMRKSKVLVDDFGEMELAGKVKDLACRCRSLFSLRLYVLERPSDIALKLALDL